jgi:hypothetical protein
MLAHTRAPPYDDDSAPYAAVAERERPRKAAMGPGPPTSWGQGCLITLSWTHVHNRDGGRRFRDANQTALPTKSDGIFSWHCLAPGGR